MGKQIKQKPISEWKCTHIMADGTIRESMKGFVVPYNETTRVAYDLLITVGMRAMKARDSEK